ncbi:2Fe-2S iron-sulfur cluster binding domain-containing protein [Trichocoleus sp. FACHB-262]|nr:2Fe-2S iron-sulfur cluster-binding protein [Trichocoleus sp. FACHB-262]MBD2120450.1 2Fe-2S iron-sulfur cluster binding domain-containing protein [Trichocoleus sp. FACHB-262]
MKTYRVELVNRDRVTLEVPENQTILEALEQAGIQLPVGCRYGACVTCAAKLLQGEIDQTQQQCLKPAQLAAGFVLLCIAYPRSDCQLEVGRECQNSLYINPFKVLKAETAPPPEL